MAKNIAEVLGYVPLTGRIQATTNGIPNVLPDGFFTTTKSVPYKSGRFTQYQGNRKTATRAEYGSPSRKVPLRAVGRRDVQLLHAFEHIDMDLETMQMLTSADSHLQDQGMSEVDEQVDHFKTRFSNLEVAATAFVLATGKIHFDENGNLLHTDSGATFSVDFGMAAANKDQGLQVDGSTPIISGDWATATTDIMGDLRNVRKTAARRTGYRPKYALYGERIPGYLTTNNSVKEFFFRNPGMNQHYLDTAELPNIGGFIWVPAYEAFYEKFDDTLKDCWDPDLVVFSPEPDLNWWCKMMGGFNVPTTYGFQTSIQESMNTFKRVEGMFAYGEPITNPPGSARLHSGHTFLPTLKVADCLFQMDVS